MYRLPKIKNREMKTDVRKLGVAFIMVTTLVLSAGAQVDYGISVNAGKSKLEQYGLKFANNFYWSSAHSIDFFVREHLSNSKISFQQGIVFGDYSTWVTLPEDVRDPELAPFEWTDRIYYAGIPIGINYHAEKWFALNVGLINNFKLKSIKESVPTKNYVLRTYAGFEFTFFRRVLFGCTYSYSLTPDHQWKREEMSDSSSKYQVVTARLGYLFR